MLYGICKSLPCRDPPPQVIHRPDKTLSMLFATPLWVNRRCIEWSQTLAVGVRRDVYGVGSV
eukprot:822494-Pelagomonas_calceolata.AAC.6